MLPSQLQREYDVYTERIMILGLGMEMLFKNRVVKDDT
jgi:hypothetical protein